MRESLLCLVAWVIGCGPNDRSNGNGSGSNVTVTAPLAPSAVIAYRDGDGPWATKTGGEAPFTFAVSSETYTVAIACVENPLRRVDVYQLTLGELQTLEYGLECRPVTGMLSGALLGNGTNGNRIQWGQSAGLYGTASEALYMLPTASGKHDLVATRGASVPDRVVMFRDVEVPPDQMIDLDFNAPNAVTLEVRQVGASGPLRQMFVSAGGTVIDLAILQDLVTVVPAAAMAPGDLHLFYVSDAGGIDGLRQQASTMQAARVPPSSVTLPPRISDRPTVSVTQAGDYVLLEATWAAQPEAVLYRLGAYNWTAHVSPAAFDVTGVLELPDLSAVPGWDPTLGLTPGFPPGRFDWGLYMVTGPDLEEALRPVPSKEGETSSSGWSGDTPI